MRLYSPKALKIFAITMIKNEADIIESFIRYHDNIFDGIVILDNGSTDNTLNIINSLIIEGYPLYLFEDNTVQYNQSEKMNKLMATTLELYSPDIILPLDADEFVTSTNKGNPRKILESLDRSKVHYIKWKTYIPSLLDQEDEIFVPKRIINFRDESLEKFYKVIITSKIIENYQVQLTMGNHSITIPKNINKVPETIELKDIKLAHFPVRTLNQIISKSVVGWMNYLTTPDRENTAGKQWEDLYIKFKKNNIIDKADIIELGKNYAVFNNQSNHSIINTFEDPVDISFCKKTDIEYTSMTEINPMKNILNNIEVIIKNYVNVMTELNVQKNKLNTIMLDLNCYIRNINEDIEIENSFNKIKNLLIQNKISTTDLLNSVESLENNKQRIYNFLAQRFYNSQVVEPIIPLLYQSLSINDSDRDTLYNLSFMLYIVKEYDLAFQYISKINTKDEEVLDLLNDIKNALML
ncbi:glycosyltransferase family 2 protein [Paenibacillus sp. PsM32]|uniref:glycosyltransferase family 2 protein n=1 Tax=Paenibacillus sp. PsM32 TaxID=3030536 RepID=UPI00263AFFA9|nr:glycosyltransferase family 2 protein [Paenibacillus sp. PsM32]MDN4620956.1 glycosyltransferase family 2 protein [Paenibacillus sp. PsM32]